ncbi:hypothetical protein GW17_00059940 [Ensete ventricosum]|nr:hypothetical protein GW17_00059940 [Ensete ventricosum]
MGGTYWSARLPVRGPPTTGWFRQKSTVSDRLREKSTIGGRLSKKKGRRGGKRRKRRKEEKKEYLSPARDPHPCAVTARAPSPPAGAFSPARGERSRRHDQSCWGQRHFRESCIPEQSPA